MGYLSDSAAVAADLIFGFDPEVYGIVLTSLKVSVSATVAASLIGVPLALLIALNNFWGKGLLRLLLNTLMALPTVVVGLFVYALIGRAGALGGLGLLFTPAGIILGETLLALPIITNLTLVAVETLDPRFFKTCRSLGGSAVRTARAALYEARLGILAALVAGFGRVVAEVGVAMILGGNIKGFTRTMTTAIALETSKGEFALGLALGVLLLLVALLVNGALFALRRRA
ncbi:MAG: ABC transporter permease [Deltaproteobacteria bacterium]|nr:MAG: ABC transporter permease [Deltaproteobacteria bacterium]